MIFLQGFLVYWAICTIIIVLRLRATWTPEVEEELDKQMIESDALCNTLGQVPRPFKVIAFGALVFFSFIFVPKMAWSYASGFFFGDK